jgi:tetratricopeptide (TPR) repeat protein
VRKKHPPAPPRAEPQNLWIYLALFVATFAVYAQVGQFDFVNFDDPEYVAHQGITPERLEWAFTSGEAANWFPITRLSHLLDFQLFGLRSGWHHLVNVLLHAGSTLLLFAFLNRSTHSRWPSAFVAMVFALHPLHVESVAWVSERKDVLSAFFWFLTLWAYVRYAEHPTATRYSLVLLPFCLGLMAKPMIVTLPFVLLLWDIWPLRRLTSRTVWEKIPFFVLSAAAAIATYLVQQHSGAVQALSVRPLGLRVENALVSYVVYIVKMFWPNGLAVFYPYPRDLPTWPAALAALALIAISVQVLRSFRVHPYLAVGWLWYLGTLVPVIGLVQVGAQARADRYMYVPMIGLIVMLAWGARDVVRHWPRAKPAMAALAAAACLFMAVLTWVQINYWQNSESLFRHALDVTDNNDVAHHNLGNQLAEDPARLPEAISHFQEALRINPDSARTHTDLGSALARIPDRLPEAIAEYEAALRIAPEAAIPHNNLGNTLLKIPGGLPRAISEYQTALRINPEYAEAHNNLGVALSEAGRLPEAISEYEAALRINPRYTEAHNNLAEAHNNLGVGLASVRGRLPESIAHFEEALRLNPNYADAHVNLGVALSEIPGRVPEAISHFEAALRINPDPEVRQALDRLRAAGATQR